MDQIVDRQVGWENNEPGSLSLSFSTAGEMNRFASRARNEDHRRPTSNKTTESNQNSKEMKTMWSWKPKQKKRRRRRVRWRKKNLKFHSRLCECRSSKKRRKSIGSSTTASAEEEKIIKKNSREMVRGVRRESTQEQKRREEKQLRDSGDEMYRFESGESRGLGKVNSRL